MGCDHEVYCIGTYSVTISIHAAQEGCDLVQLESKDKMRISIHAAQEGCDRNMLTRMNVYIVFQSTQPKRAATFAVTEVRKEWNISIHAAQEGCDLYLKLSIRSAR